MQRSGGLRIAAPHCGNNSQQAEHGTKEEHKARKPSVAKKFELIFWGPKRVQHLDGRINHVSTQEQGYKGNSAACIPTEAVK